MIKRLLIMSVMLIAALTIAPEMSKAETKKEPTAQEKFDALKAKGIFSNIASSAEEMDKINRAQFARVTDLLMGVEKPQETPKKQVNSAPFPDVPLAHEYVEEVARLKEAGILDGYPDGTFRPDSYLTLEEMAKVTAHIMELPLDEDAEVPGAAPWAGPYIQALMEAGVSYPVNYAAASTRFTLLDTVYLVYNHQLENNENMRTYSLDDYSEMVYEQWIVLSGTKHRGLLKLEDTLIAVDDEGRWSEEVELSPGPNELRLAWFANEGDETASEIQLIEIYYAPPPLIEPIEDAYGYVNQTLSLQVKAKIADNGFLIYSATGLPHSMYINPASGLITGSIGTAGVYPVTVTVKEGGGDTGTVQASSQSFNWTISWPTVYEPSPPRDTTPPSFVELPAQTVNTGDVFHAAINEPGWIYAVPISMISSGEPDSATLEQWSSLEVIAKLEAASHTPVAIDTSLLTPGSLYLYGLDQFGNLSTGVIITVADPEPEVSLEIVDIVWQQEEASEEEEPYTHIRGVDLLVTINKKGIVYFIDASALPNEGDPLDVENFPLIDAEFAAFANAEANTPVSISTDNLNGYANYYFVVAVDEEGNYIMSSYAFRLFPIV